MLFEVIIGLKTAGEYPKLIEALTKFIEGIKTNPNRGSVQWLESANFVVMKGETAQSDIPVDFYGARDMACTIGVLKDQEIQTDVPEPAIEIIKALFQNHKSAFSIFM